VVLFTSSCSFDPGVAVSGSEVRVYAGGCSVSVRDGSGVSVIVAVWVIVGVTVGVLVGVWVGGGSWVGVKVDISKNGVFVDVPLREYFRIGISWSQALSRLVNKRKNKMNLPDFVLFIIFINQ
jgi:hypothetical protein